MIFHLVHAKGRESAIKKLEDFKEYIKMECFIYMTCNLNALKTYKVGI
jgi:hypothetical protein